MALKSISITSALNHVLPLGKGFKRAQPKTFTGPNGVRVQVLPRWVAHVQHKPVADRDRLPVATMPASLRPLELKRALSNASGPGILDQAAPAKGRSNASVKDLLGDVHEQLYKGRVSKEAMFEYVKMGESIVAAIAQSADGKPPLTATINGETIKIPSTLETTRAVLWYLQAKSIADNAGEERGATTPGLSGAMILKDPDSKLLGFLSCYPCTYSRISTHMKDESVEKKQKGIEDFGSRMPGAGGTLLFSGLKPGADGTNLLYLKIETSGVPMPNLRHSDPESGALMGIAYRMMSIGRTLRHVFSFVDMVLLKNADVGNRSEKMSKGDILPIYVDFKAALKAQTWLSAEDRVQIATMLATQRATGLGKALDVMIAKGKAAGQDASGLEDIRQRLQAFHAQMGNDLGINRYGNEVHATLETRPSLRRGA